MIVKTLLLEPGLECHVPEKYVPNKDVFKKYAELYGQEEEDLYERIKECTEVEEADDLSSEEKEDNEIRAADRLALALFSSPEECRVDVYVYDTETEAFYVHHDIFLHDTPTSFAVLPGSGRPLILVADEKGRVSVYGLFVTNHFFPDAVIEAHENPITGIDASPKRIFTTDGITIRVWSAVTHELVHETKESRGVSALRAESDTACVFASGSSVLRYDLKSGKTTEILKTQAVITAITVKPEVVVAGTDEGRIVYRKGDVEKAHKIHTDAVLTVQTMGERYIITCSKDETLAVYDTEVGEIVHRKDLPMDAVSISAAKDDSYLYVYPQSNSEIDLGSLSEVLHSDE